MPNEDIARIETTMDNLVSLTREQNATLNKMLITLTETRTTQAADSKRIDKLEADKTWIFRYLVGLFIAAMFALIKLSG